MSAIRARVATHRVGLVTAGTTVLLLVCAGCGGGEARPTPGPVTPRTFTYVSDTSPIDGWDPATAGAEHAAAVNDVYETLTRYDSTHHKVTGLLAADWQSDSDRLTWRFSLRSGVKFHSGRTMDAQAVKAAIQRTAWLNPSSVWRDVRSISTPNNGTVKILLTHPAPLAQLAAADHGAFIYDTSVTGPKPADDAMTGKDAGTGPYTIARWRAHDTTRLRLTHFPGYWRGWQGRHYTDVRFMVVRDPASATRRLRSSGAIIAMRLPPKAWKSLRGVPAVQTSQTPSWQDMFALLDTERLDATSVRHAICYGIDYDGVVRALHDAQAKAVGVVPEGLYGHFADLPMYRHDVDRATSLLAEKGYGPGKKRLKLTLAHPPDPRLADAAHRISDNLGKLNIDVTVRSGEPSAGKQDIALVYRHPNAPVPYGWFAGTFASGAPGNLGRYTDKTFDRLLAGVRATAARDQTRAAQTYRRMQTILLDDAPAVFLGSTLYQRAFRTAFLGYTDDPAYPDVVFVYNLAART